MMDDEFEWDDVKAARNKRDHGITFERARAVFEDLFAVGWPDPDEVLEERFLTVGMAGRSFLYVVYTMRDQRIRIVSARRAERHERRRYHDGQSS
jgi:uncharacterized DUF497 family protein